MMMLPEQVDESRIRENDRRAVPRCAPISLPYRSRYASAKAVLDAILAIVLLIMLSPVILMAMAAVRLSSRGPSIYAQIRLGLAGRPFTIYKIRTMYDRCEERSGPRWCALRGDARVTPVGWFLRATKLDELPQLWNVIRGEMSLVGPRPERPVFVDELERAIPYYRHRLLVRPGLTGLAQVQLPPDTDLESVGRKLACDLYYVRHLGPWMDLRILAGTATYLVGVPFWISETWLGVPGQEIADHSYRSLVESGECQVRPA